MKKKRSSRGFEISVAILSALYHLAAGLDDALTHSHKLALVIRRSTDLSRYDAREAEVRAVLARLLYRKMIVRSKAGFKLTQKGFERAQSYFLRHYQLPTPPKAWDGSWRLVIFDIPEDARFLRRVFRTKLRQLGFVLVQQSVWLYPYPCEKQLIFLAQYLGLEKYVLIADVSHLSNDRRWRKQFKLSD